MIDVTEHLKLVHKTINDNFVWMTSFFDYDDIFQEGCLGLVKAAKLYDSQKSEFSTYATRTIWNQIALMYRGERFIPNPSTEKVNLYMESLDKPIETKNGPVCLMNMLEDKTDQFNLKEKSILVDQLLGRIKENERRVIVEYYFNSKTQKVIAEEIGMSQIYVSRLITKSLEKMRRVV